VENATGASRLHRPPITSITRFRPPRKTRTTRNQILASPFRVFRVFRGEHSDAWVRSPNLFTTDHADFADQILTAKIAKERKGPIQRAFLEKATKDHRGIEKAGNLTRPFRVFCVFRGGILRDRPQVSCLRFQVSGFAARKTFPHHLDHPIQIRRGEVRAGGQAQSAVEQALCHLGATSSVSARVPRLPACGGRRQP
jgi:hypothetical protein